MAPRNTTFGFIAGVRPGVKVHILLSPGGCNTTVVQDVIVPDFLPPSFTDVQRVDSSAPKSAEVRTVPVISSKRGAMMHACLLVPAWLAEVSQPCCNGAPLQHRPFEHAARSHHLSLSHS